MSIVSISLLVVLAGMVIAFLAKPFFSKSQFESAEQQEIELHVTYERVLQSIRNLDEDHATGKIAEDTYHFERERLAQLGVKILQELNIDESDPAIRSSVRIEEEEMDDDLDNAIEQAIAAYRQARAEA